MTDVNLITVRQALEAAVATAKGDVTDFVFNAELGAANDRAAKATAVQNAVNVHIDTAVAPLETAVAAAETAAATRHAALLANILTGGFGVGAVQRFRAGFVPSTHSEIGGSYSAIPSGTKMVAAGLARTTYSAAFVAVGGYLYCITRSVVYKYTPSTNSWDAGTLMTGLTAWGSSTPGYAVATPSGKILFGGGTITGNLYQSTAFLLDPVTMTYAAVQSSPVALLAVANGVKRSNGDAVVFSSSTGTHGATTGAAANTTIVYTYNEGANAWTSHTLASAPIAGAAWGVVMGEMPIVPLPSGKVMVVDNNATAGSAITASIIDVSALSVVSSVTGAAMPAGAGQQQQLHLVATLTGCYLIVGNNARVYTESTDSWAASTFSPFAGNLNAVSTTLTQGFSKGQGYLLTNLTYMLVNSATFSSPAALVTTIVFNGLPTVGIVDAYSLT